MTYSGSPYSGAPYSGTEAIPVGEPLTPKSVASTMRVPGPVVLADPWAPAYCRPASVASVLTVPGPRRVPLPTEVTPCRPRSVESILRVPGPWPVVTPTDPTIPTIPAGPARVDARLTVPGYPDLTAAQAAPAINDLGTGSFTTRAPGPAADAVVGFDAGGRRIFTGRATSITDNEVTGDEEAGQLVQVEVAGLLVEWERAVVLPDFGAQDVRRIGHPTQDVRVFDWTMNGLGNASFGEYGVNIIGSRSIDATASALDGPFPLPDVWPDPWARWMWASDPARPARRGWCHYRVPTPLAARASDVDVWCAAYDYAEVWLDGVPIATCDSPGVAQRVRVPLSRDHHLITIRAYNSGGHAGVLFTMLPVDPGGLYGEPVMNSRSGWKALAYPSRTFISTPGQVLYRLRLEARRRRVADVPDWRFDFGNLTDSAGRPWPRPTPITLDVGMSYLDVLNRLAEDRLDYVASPSGRILRAFVKDRGTGRAAAAPWTAGVDLLSRATKRETR